MFLWKAIAATAATTAALLTAPAAMSQTTGFAEFVAKVNSNGSIARGSGVTTAARTAAGAYTVTFSRDISACYPVASVNGDSGFVNVSQPPASPTQVKVFTFSTGGTAANRTFVLLVRCQD